MYTNCWKASSTVWQLVPQVLWRVEILAWRVNALATALCTHIHVYPHAVQEVHINYAKKVQMWKNIFIHIHKFLWLLSRLPGTCLPTRLLFAKYSSPEQPLATGQNFSQPTWHHTTKSSSNILSVLFHLPFYLRDSWHLAVLHIQIIRRMFRTNSVWQIIWLSITAMVQEMYNM